MSGFTSFFTDHRMNKVGHKNNKPNHKTFKRGFLDYSRGILDILVNEKFVKDVLEAASSSWLDADNSNLTGHTHAQVFICTSS